MKEIIKPIKSPALSLDFSAINHYVDLEFAKNLIQQDQTISENSKQDYCYRLATFFDFLRLNNGWDLECLFEYKKWLTNHRKYTTASKIKYLAVAIILCKRLYDFEIKGQRILSANLLLCHSTGKKIKNFPIQKHVKNGITKAEMNRIKKHLGKSDDIRLKLLVYLMAYQGLRISEIQGIQIEDIKFAPVNSMITIRGKGGYEDQITLLPSVAMLLKEYKKVKRIRSGSLFDRGVRQLQYIVTNFLRDIGIYDKSCHSFRHFYITQLAVHKMTPTEIIAYSRHKNLNSVMSYIDDYSYKQNLKRVTSIFEA